MNHNLIFNARWCARSNGVPAHFSGQGITYDNLTINGFCTSSITLPAGCTTTGYSAYTLPINVRGKQAVCWGCILRAAEAEGVFLVADFYGENGESIGISRCPVAQNLTYQFTRQMARFPVPRCAAAVKLSIEFEGTVTACTFYAPLAYYE